MSDKLNVSRIGKGRKAEPAEEAKTQIGWGKLVDEAVRSYVVLELISEH